MHTFSPNTLIESAKVNENFDDLADGSGDDDSNSLRIARDELYDDFVNTGLIWTGDNYGVNLNGSMSTGIIYINGRRLSIGAVTAHGFTASKDTYVDILDNADGTGTVVYTEVANGAASPALAANSVRIAKVVTNGTSIAAATSIVQWGSDSLTNTIYPDNPLASWRTWVPSWTGFTPGSATIAAYYKKVGKIVHFRLRVTLSGSTMGDVFFTLPITAAATEFTGNGGRNIGVANYFDASGGDTNGMCQLSSVTQARLFVYQAAGTYLGNSVLSTTVPITWANSDIFAIRGSYEAAS